MTATEIREAHVRHESRLRAVGWLYAFFAAALGMVAAGLWRDSGGPPQPGDGFFRGLIVFAALMAAASLVLAAGFLRLNPWVRLPATIVSGLGLLLIPVGTILHGYILMQVWSPQGQRILKPDYADIIAATPEVRFRRTAGDWVAAVLLVAAAAVALNWVRSTWLG